MSGGPTTDTGTATARDLSASRPRTETSTAVALRDAAVRLGGQTVWSRVSVTVGEGEFVAVLGPNGAGKSTLIRAVLGLLPLAVGEASVLSRSPGHARLEIGYLPQRHGFDGGARIRGVDLVRLGLDGTRWGVPFPGLPGNRETSRRVAEVIELVGASGYARRPIGELSGGEQQRLLIAQALARRPRLLLLDEPLDSLDLPNQAAVAALVRRICKDEDVAVMLVTHDINPILGYLDRVIYLAAGTAVEGRPEDVVSSETLTRLYGAPVEVLRASDGRLVVVGQPEAPFVHGHRHDHA
jgi:zinc/manganese transport system ATP-binding protein